VPHADVVDMLAGYDAVAVPSQLMETGPLVVLEAFAAGIPVIGSRLGGIAATVRPGVDGYLVEPFDAPDAWARVLTDFARNPGALRRLKAGVRPPRATAAVADDMVSLYRRIVGERVTAERT
jgi:glycosyltransferase involved in cell wall biosynthesis